MSLKIAIAGGGIAGLTAALALSKNGHAVTVFERAETHEDIGAGIQISPNAGKLLGTLGLSDAIKEISFEPHVLALIEGKTGKVLSTLPFKAMMGQRYGAPYLVTHRGDLQAALLNAVTANPLVEIHSSRLMDRFNNNADSVEVAGKKYDFLMVADGINSRLRSQIDPDARLVLEGQTAWRATLPIEKAGSVQNAVSVYMNGGAHLVAYQMGVRPVLNLVYVAGGDQPPNAMGFGRVAQELINGAQDWKPWPLASVQSDIWHKGRAVMVGDAAHAMTPHAAQGGAMAIEDAMVLALCVEKAPTIEAAFVSFQAKRQPRIKCVKTLSRQNRAIYQMSGLNTFGRNLVMPLIPPSLLLKRLDWLYGW